MLWDLLASYVPQHEGEIHNNIAFYEGFVTYDPQHEGYTQAIANQSVFFLFGIQSVRFNFNAAFLCRQIIREILC